MNQIYPGTHSLQSRFQKVCRQIEDLLQAGKAFSFQKITELVKRRDRYAKRLLLQPSALMKAGSVVLLASALSLTSHAQSATYVRADSINPVRRAGLPQGLSQPTFVDIDGDGDLDCFETSLAGTYHNSVQVTFLRNTGTKKSPYYVLDTTSFPKDLGTTTAGSGVTRLQFVDIDGDGDYDLFAGTAQQGDNYLTYGTLVYYKNTGTAKKAKFVKAPTENPLSSVSGYYGVYFSFADFDKDGDYDVITTDLYGSTFYKNTGTAKKPQFTYLQGQYGLAPFYPAPSVFVYDYNKDGRADVFYSDPFYKVGNLTYNRNEAKQKGGLRFVKDTVNVPKMPSGFVTFEFTDINNDGVAEAFTASGEYAVAAKTSAATDKEAIAITAVNNAVSVKAYPNPFTGSFVVNLGGSSLLNTVIRIADLQGRLVSTVKANSNAVQLGSNLQKGIYVVQVIQDSKVVFTQKVIKQ